MNPELVVRTVAHDGAVHLRAAKAQVDLRQEGDELVTARFRGTAPPRNWALLGAHVHTIGCTLLDAGGLVEASAIEGVTSWNWPETLSPPEVTVQGAAVVLTITEPEDAPPVAVRLRSTEVALTVTGGGYMGPAALRVVGETLWECGLAAERAPLGLLTTAMIQTVIRQLGP